MLVNIIVGFSEVAKLGNWEKSTSKIYTIGFDAKVAEIVSKLPQDLINRLVKAGMKAKDLVPKA